jgi:2,4-dienoyl-CoA reductase-like NADH-dependent reductase (Old Yellow Enzyme family)/thioredoxin reductase
VVSYLAEFADTMHRYEVPVIAQITHRGRRGRSDHRFHRVYAPSPIREPNHRETPHELDEATITEFVRAFADAAQRLKQGRFDGCEVMASHCHLIDQFWTPNANRRADEYGGSLSNRLRFGVRVIEAIRERCGDDFIIGIRITGDDFTPGGLDNATMKEITRRLDAPGLLDYFSVIGSTAETFVGEARAVPDMTFERMTYARLAASIKQATQKPVITAGRVTQPMEAEHILASGRADLVIMTRALIADPQLPDKARSGRLDDIQLCRGYNEGCIDRIYTGRGVTCVQNAMTGRETELGELAPSDTPRKVVIVGGGPAGLEAARVARWRGHDVVLMEQSNELGGQTLIAAKAPLRGEFAGASQWLAHQCRKLGVDIRLNCLATVESIVRERPDVVVVATGAQPLKPDIVGIEAVRDAWSVLNGDIPSGERIAVIDEEYGFQGPSTAEMLLDAGKRVDIITSMEAIGTRLGATTRPPMYQRLFKKGIVIHPHLRVRAIEGDTLNTENAWSQTVGQLTGYDAVVYAFGGQAVDWLSPHLKGKVSQVFVIGDAFAPRTLQHAILEGHIFARKI